MGFWDENSEDDFVYEQLPFATEDDKRDWIRSGETLHIFGVREGKTEYGERWFVDLVAGSDGTGGTRYSMPLARGVVPSRDAMLAKMKKSIERGGEEIPVSLSKQGRTIIIGQPRGEQGVLS
jgi:hypothetical protein